jgi:general secretion pathway protein G
MSVPSAKVSRALGRARAPGRANPEAGFTLLELLVVLAILGMLAAFAVPQVMSYLDRAKSDSAKIQISNISTALDLYRLDVGRYPSTSEGLSGLVNRPTAADRWNGPYVKKEESLIDPWNEPYGYRSPGQHGAYDLYSLGADKAEGGEGEDRDVTSW